MTVLESALCRRIAWLGLASLACLAGCTSAAPHYEAHFGEAVRQTLQAQVLDPQAAEKAEQAQGVDGVAAREAMQRYRDSFRTPPPVVHVTNIGNVSR